MIPLSNNPPPTQFSSNQALLQLGSRRAQDALGRSVVVLQPDQQSSSLNQLVQRVGYKLYLLLSPPDLIYMYRNYDVKMKDKPWGNGPARTYKEESERLSSFIPIDNDYLSKYFISVMDQYVTRELRLKHAREWFENYAQIKPAYYELTKERALMLFCNEELNELWDKEFKNRFDEMGISDPFGPHRSVTNYQTNLERLVNHKQEWSTMLLSTRIKKICTGKNTVFLLKETVKLGLFIVCASYAITKGINFISKKQQPQIIRSKL